jgi:hypothetical protein
MIPRLPQRARLRYPAAKLFAEYSTRLLKISTPLESARACQVASAVCMAIRPEPASRSQIARNETRWAFEEARLF